MIADAAGQLQAPSLPTKFPCDQKIGANQKGEKHAENSKTEIMNAAKAAEQIQLRKRITRLLRPIRSKLHPHE